MTVNAAPAPEELIIQLRDTLAHVYHGDSNAMRVGLTELGLFGAPIRLNNEGMLEIAHGDSFRADSYQASATPYDRDDLVTVLQDVLMKKRAKLQAKEIFQTSNEVTPGSVSWRAYRVDYTGQPRPLDRGGNANDTPYVTLNTEREDFPVEYYILGLRINYIEQLAAQNIRSRINARARKMTSQRDSMDRFTDGLIWNDPYGKIRTIFDNPWIAEYLPSTVFKTQGTGTAMYQAVLMLVNTPADLHNAEEGDTPDLLATSPRVKAAMASTHLDEDKKYTVLQAILDQTSIGEVRAVSALAGIGPNGEDGMVAIDTNSIQIQTVMEPTVVPDTRGGLVEKSYMVAGHGGAKILDATNHARAYVTWEMTIFDA